MQMRRRKVALADGKSAVVNHSYCQSIETWKTQTIETRKTVNGQPLVMSTNRDMEISQWATTRNVSQ